MWKTVAMPARQYNQKLRAESAAETRQRILDAVAERMRTAPTEPVSIDQVARLAKVARSTIYVVFDSRVGLFEAFAEDLFDRTGLADLAQATKTADALETLRLATRAACRMFAGDLDVYRVLNAMARLDPDAVGQVIDKAENDRRRGMGRLARRLAEEGYLRDDVTAEQALDRLWLLGSFDAFYHLHVGRGLGADAAAEVLSDTAERALCR
jgi:AcrR family transcriptional regulator